MPASLPVTAPGRVPDAAVDPVFPGRWSPRAFSPRAVPAEALDSIFEAARWAPSSFNDQPWLFFFARQPEDLARFRGWLHEFNQSWANQAPVLIFVAARRHFAHNGTPNRVAVFDSGAAWMSLALQAHELGLVTHGMAGIDVEKVHRELGLSPEQYEVIAAIALGYPGDPATLPEQLREREVPSGRKPRAEIAIEGNRKLAG